jgi:hypothetical protein
LSDIEWLRKCDAPRELSDLFGELSERRLNFDSHKTSNSLALTEWLVANKPDVLQEITDYVEALVSKVEGQGSG